MRFRSSACTLGLAMTVAACGSSFESQKVWSASSTSLRLGFQYWPRGAAAWERSRAELTPAQLAVLDRLVSQPPVSSHMNDAQEVLVHVTDANGSAADYRVVLGNEFARGILSESLPTIDYWTIRPLLEPLRCLLSEETRDEGTRAGLDPVTGHPLPPWTVAPTMNDDPGCVHYTTAQPSSGVTWVRLESAAPGPKRVTLVACAADAKLSARTPDGVTELAVSQPVAPPACPSLAVPDKSPLLIGIEGGTQLRVGPP